MRETRVKPVLPPLVPRKTRVKLVLLALVVRETRVKPPGPPPVREPRPQ